MTERLFSAALADRREEIFPGVAEGSVLLTGFTTIDVIRTAKILA